MGKAIGMIETRGIATSIEAGDAMLKAADVRFRGQNKKDPALVTVLIEGDVAAVQEAVEAGRQVAEKVGSLIAYNVIPHPDNETNDILIDQKKMKTIPKKNR